MSGKNTKVHLVSGGETQLDDGGQLSIRGVSEQRFPKLIWDLQSEIQDH